VAAAFVVAVVYRVLLRAIASSAAARIQSEI